MEGRLVCAAEFGEIGKDFLAERALKRLDVCRSSARQILPCAVYQIHPGCPE
jgi:hypothetical protein